MGKIHVVIASVVLVTGFHAGAFAQEARTTTSIINARTRAPIDAQAVVASTAIDLTSSTSPPLSLTDIAYKKLDSVTGIVCNAGIVAGKGHDSLFVNIATTDQDRERIRAGKASNDYNGKLCDEFTSLTFISTINKLSNPQDFSAKLIGTTIVANNAFIERDKYRHRLFAYIPITAADNRFTVFQGRNVVPITALDTNLVRIDTPAVNVGVTTTIDSKGVTANGNKRSMSTSTSVRGVQREEGGGFFYWLRNLFNF